MAEDSEMIFGKPDDVGEFMTKKDMIAKLEKFLKEGRKGLEGDGCYPSTCCEGADMAGRRDGMESVLDDLSYLVDDLKKALQ